MSVIDDILYKAQAPLSRKGFMATAGVGLAASVAGAFLPSCGGGTSDGDPPEDIAGKATVAGAPAGDGKPLSPPAMVPSDKDKPIELEEIHSQYDRDTGPVPNPMPPDERVGYALVGLGHLTLNQILPALMKCAKSRPVALVSGSAEKMRRVAAQYGIDPKNCVSYQDYEKLAQVPECQAVYIVLPNALHAEFTIRAAKMGKHVLCEKPMATSAAEARTMTEACREAGVKLMIAYRIQYQPHNAYVREQVQKAAYGKPRVMETVNVQSAANPRHWRLKKALAGGGALPDIGLYCLNTTRFLLGEEPMEVFAYMYSSPGDDRFTEVEELMSWQMRFASGLVANCSCDYNAHESRHYRLLCEKGWLDMDNAYAYEGQHLKTSRADGPIVRIEEVSISPKDQFMLEMEHFSDCIRHDRHPNTPGEEGVQDHVIMDAIYESARTGKAVKLGVRS